MRDLLDSIAGNSRLRRSRPPESEIPTSSMADVAFLLIVFFLVSAAFAVTRGLDFALPKPEDSKLVDPVESVLIEVGRGGALSVDGHNLPLDGLLGYLEPKLRANPGKPVIVRPVDGARYGDAVDVLDELRQGRRRLGLAADIDIALPTWREIEEFWPS